MWNFFLSWCTSFNKKKKISFKTPHFQGLCSRTQSHSSRKMLWSYALSTPGILGFLCQMLLPFPGFPKKSSMNNLHGHPLCNRAQSSQSCYATVLLTLLLVTASKSPTKAGSLKCEMPESLPFKAWLKGSMCKKSTQTIILNNSNNVINSKAMIKRTWNSKTPEEMHDCDEWNIWAVSTQREQNRYLVHIWTLTRVSSGFNSGHLKDH